MFAGAGVPWHVFSSFAKLFFEFEFDLHEERGGGVRNLHVSPLDPQFSAFSILLHIILVNIVCVQTIFIQLGEKNPDFLFWNVPFTTSDFNTQPELESQMGILHCKRHWKYPDDNV